ncbi:type VI secretion system protein TssA [Niveispirillum sp. SYP-B3756]|uniref:type VI secretion system protein TssA n=1 Tax=Niveispirillum sp. SYP-B3756 TaxID=2662178 RepID=UPI001291BAD1|nr:type VI secretion system protein TssA [Niveispirillum sp. SYP-B3756]MQP67332.1 type VI secretion system protein TssA [Niveispirillum sp. SYP-B3756]
MVSIRDANSLLDMDALLAPIPGGDPSGEDIRYGGEYDLIKEARREEIDLPQGVWKADRKRADWAEVIRLASAVLADRSKDLQVAAWLCEGLLARHGVPGLIAGLLLPAHLLNGFGLDCHPRPDEDGDLSRRALIFEWLNERLVVLLLTLQVTNPPADREMGLTFGDFLNSQRLQTLAGRESRPPPRGGQLPVTLQLFNATARATPASFYRELYQGLMAALAALDQLKTALNGALGDQAPSLHDLSQRLHEMAQWVLVTLRERGEEPAMLEVLEPDPIPTEALTMEDGEERAEPAAATAALSPARGIANRRDAYRQLSEIADFLAKTEPHSPTPYLLHRIVQWRDLPLPALLLELSRGRRDVAAIFELLGLPEEG